MFAGESAGGINRYIMECKYDLDDCAQMYWLIELIDTLWNVNNFITSEDTIFVLELIDTLWNVNKEILISNTQDITELIDTLWNVNTLLRLKTQSLY